ncbi:hypothetical protein BI292_03345 [Pseudomonas sp. 43NM1]|uniref:hypothetical protein n=1 Tax=Pseudomonas sp. 43NM1 TaxID=1904755 RepID=UPI000C340C32|nr:hypothetical protein [Pseudomonas sp. 43NM1]PKH20613.1 hypothetical protein BI292_03345 [Pseudomonas sp. 43NM1]
MLDTTDTEKQGRRLNELQLKRIICAQQYLYDSPITGYLSDAVFVGNTCIGIIFDHSRKGPYEQFQDGHMIRTSHILSVHKEGRFWVLTTLNSLYVVTSFKRRLGRSTFKKLDAFGCLKACVR